MVADIGDRVGGVEAELHTRLDAELGYTKRKVEQTHQLRSGRIDDEVGVLAERVEHGMLECQVKAMYEGSATQEDGIAWFQSKVRAQQQQRQTFAQADHERCRNHFAHFPSIRRALSSGGVA